jgi:penicillin-binding protein 1A
MQMASAYGVFANGGHLLAPVLIRRITDAEGHVLHDAAVQQPGEANRAIAARNAFVMGSMLQEVTRSGTAAKAQALLKRPDLYGKTGTTNDAVDAWFAGFQPGLVAVAWIGYDQPRSLGAHEFGATLALPVWTEFMQQALRDAPVRELVPPAGLREQEGDWVYEEAAPAESPTSAPSS